MVGNTPIKPEIAAQIVAFRKAGWTQIKISEELGLSQSAVARIFARYQSTGSFHHRKSPGRPRVTSHRMDKLIKRAVVVNPQASSSSIADGLPDKISARTVRRRLLKDFGLKSFNAARKPRLSAQNIKDRLRFAKKYKDWTPEQWRKVLFSDETCVQQFNYGKTLVRRPKGERYNPRFTTATVKHSPSLMIWGCISAQGRGGLWFLPKKTTINGTVYLNILKEKLRFWMNFRDCQVFQHDGAPCHRRKDVKEWLATENIQELGPWPGQSPDINPIENCWHILKSKVRELKPTSMSDLEEKIKHVWCQNITAEYCEKLINSMPTRLEAIISARGYATKY